MKTRRNRPPVVVQSGPGAPRKGRGFSDAELEAAGLTRTDARRLRLPVDARRRSCHADNVATIKQRAGVV